MLGYLLDATGYLGYGMVAIVVFLLVLEGILFCKGRRISWLERIFFVLFGVYLTVILAVTVSPVYGFTTKMNELEINMKPFAVLVDGHLNPMNLFGNIAMFMPIGFLLPFVSRKMQHGVRAILVGGFLSALIEFLQMFLRRGTDIDDVILNTIGTAIGYIIAGAFLSIFPSFKRMIGIEEMKNGKKLRRDFFPTVLLTTMVLASVMITGFEKRQQYASEGMDYAYGQGEAKEKEVANKNKLNAIEKDNEKEESVELPKDILAKNVFFMNVTKDEVVSSLRADDRIAPASTTKMLTAMTVLEYCNTQEIVTVGDEISLVPANASRAGIYTGNQVTVEQLLEGLLLPSGGDAAYALATHVGHKILGDTFVSVETAMEAFVGKMNEKAKNLGAMKSHFTTPDGFDEKGQYSTASDLGIIAAAFLSSTKEDGILKTIVGKESSRVCFPDGTDLTWENTNLLLVPSSEYYYNKAIGLKTGSTENAGKCLISAAIIHDDIYIAVVMGDTEEGRYLDSIALYKSVE